MSCQYTSVGGKEVHLHGKALRRVQGLSNERILENVARSSRTTRVYG